MNANYITHYFIDHLLLHDPISFFQVVMINESYPGIFLQLRYLVGSNFSNLFTLVSSLNSKKDES